MGISPKAGESVSDPRPEDSLVKESFPAFFTEFHRDCLSKIFDTIRAHYGDRLVSLVVYGSYSHGSPRLNSDLDLLIVLDSANWTRSSQKTEEFVRNVEEPCDEDLQALHRQGITMELSPLILTRAEALHFLPVYLDMVSHHVIIEDKQDFFRKILQKVREQMARWGSKRVNTGGHWLWEIRPDLKWNEVIRYDE